LKWDTVRCSTRAGFGLVHTSLISLIKIDRDKHYYSLFCDTVRDEEKRFYSICAKALKAFEQNANAIKTNLWPVL
jgi:hypothetical protein